MEEYPYLDEFSRLLTGSLLKARFLMVMPMFEGQPKIITQRRKEGGNVQENFDSFIDHIAGNRTFLLESCSQSAGS
jgi:hypothetical protein